VTIEFIPDGHVTSPRGYLAGAVYAGIKTYGESKLDLGLLVSERPCTAAGVFTRSTVQGAPVIVSRKHLASGRARGIVVNSGCSNVCTGAQGIADAIEMATLAARRVGCDPHEFVVASTGVIGHLLPMDKIRDGLARIALSADGGEALSRAILTTDTRPKRIAATFTVAGVRYTVGGIAKGSGMIHPDMATMFGFLTTDAAVERAHLDRVLRAAVDQTFNMVSVDGDTSTSDTVTLFANGAAGGEAIGAGHPAAGALLEAVTAVARHLAREIARDGEGATKLIEIRVTGAATEDEARRAARTISASPLVKSAVYGNDPNWGRIMMAVGRSGAAVDLDRVRVAIGEALMYADGRPLPIDPAVTRRALAGPEVVIHAHLGVGPAEATAWGCDLTEEYVKINAEYTT
jgi:glutamate N-acetyltransferase/amino-acid N-acetyltransferase